MQRAWRRLRRLIPPARQNMYPLVPDIVMYQLQAIFLMNFYYTSFGRSFHCGILLGKDAPDMADCLNGMLARATDLLSVSLLVLSAAIPALNFLEVASLFVFGAWMIVMPFILLGMAYVRDLFDFTDVVVLLPLLVFGSYVLHEITDDDFLPMKAEFPLLSLPWRGLAALAFIVGLYCSIVLGGFTYTYN